MATRNLITSSLKSILAALIFIAVAVPAQADVVYRFVALSATGWQGVPIDFTNGLWPQGEVVLTDEGYAAGSFSVDGENDPSLPASLWSFELNGIVSANFDGMGTDSGASLIHFTGTVSGQYLNVDGLFYNASATERVFSTDPASSLVTIWYGGDGPFFGQPGPYDPISNPDGTGAGFTGYFIQNGVTQVPEPGSLALLAAALVCALASIATRGVSHPGVRRPI